MKLKRILPKRSARGFGGRLSVRHQGGRAKQYLREIDFARSIRDIPAKVTVIEYDPTRTANLALLLYRDGQRSYILAPEGLSVGDEVVAGDLAEIRVGNALPLGKIPIGTQVHNVEIKPGKGAELVRSAGAAAVIQGKEDSQVLLKLPSGEIRKFDANAFATIGQVGNIPHKTEKFAKAGDRRHLGIRPTVRGVAMHPAAHPHGGGEGRSGIGMPSPKTPWGKPARGLRTRKKKKYSDKWIIERRK